MLLQNPKFITSMVKYDVDEIEKLNQIAVVGKSNVGKSSFINCIFNSNKLSKVGKTPGKTRLLNFFLIDESFYLVDLPGYGFAKVSKKERDKWGHMIEHYLKNNEKLKLIIMLVDIRHDPTQDDYNMYEWIKYFDIPCVIIATKAEKIAKTKRKQACEKIAKLLRYSEKIYPIDSSTKYGKENIIDVFKNIDINSEQ